jgi:hypothetical protein
MSQASELISEMSEVGIGGVHEFKLPSLKAIRKRLKSFKKSKVKKPKVAFNVKAAKKKQGKSFWKKFFEGMNEDLDEDKMKALAEFKGVELDDVEDSNYAFEVDGEEWEVLTDREADEKLKDYIRESVWAFNTDFLASHIDAEDVVRQLGLESSFEDEDGEEVEIGDDEEVIHMNTGMNLVELIKSFQEKFEDGNSDLIGMIGDFDRFVSDAESSDGRGHFLSGYDGEEVEMGKFFGYRIN